MAVATSTVLAAIGAAASIASSFQQASAIDAQTQAQTQAARARQQADEYNAQIARQNQQIVRGQTQAELDKADRERRLRLGSARASAGALGGTDVGDIIQSSAVQEELDLLTIRSEGLLRERQFGTEADLLDASAAGTAAQIPLIKSAGRASKSAAVLGGLSKGLGSF